MAPMRRALCILCLLLGCKPSLPPIVVAPPPPPEPRCRVTDVEVSGALGGVRPSLAAGKTGFLVAWEDESEVDRRILARAFGDDGQPRGPATMVAPSDLRGTEPRLVAVGDGFRVVWSDVGQIRSLALDADGTPHGDIATLATAPDVRVLAVSSLGQTGFSVAFWSWSQKPARQWLSTFDANGKPHGPPVLLSSAPILEAQVSLHGARAAWLEMVGDLDHVLVGTPRKHDDLGLGTAPSVATGRVAWAKPAENAVWLRSDGSPAGKVAPGLAPRLGDSGLCYFSEGTDPEHPADELRCRTWTQKPRDEDMLVASLSGGVLNLSLAERPLMLGLALQTDQDDRMKVRFATVRCRW